MIWVGMLKDVSLQVGNGNCRVFVAPFQGIAPRVIPSPMSRRARIGTPLNIVPACILVAGAGLVNRYRLHRKRVHPPDGHVSTLRFLNLARYRHTILAPDTGGEACSVLALDVVLFGGTKDQAESVAWLDKSNH
jgi:hypothetical protein